MSNCNNENDDICKCSPRLIDEEYQGSDYIVRYNDTFFRAPVFSTNTQIMCDLLPEGSIMDWVSDTPPPWGWLVLDGSFFDIVTYPELYNVLSSDQLPDLRGLTTVHQNNIDTGTPINNISQPQGTVVGQAWQQISLGQMPDHTHTVEDEYWVYDARENVGNDGFSPSKIMMSPRYIRQGVTAVVGKSTPFTIVQPSYTTNKIIKACPIREVNLHTLPPDDRYNLPLIPFPDIPFNPNLSSGDTGINVVRFNPLDACDDFMCVNLSGNIFDERQITLTKDAANLTYTEFYDIFPNYHHQGVPLGSPPLISASDIDGISEYETELSAYLSVTEVNDGEFLSSAYWTMDFRYMGLSAHPTLGMQPPSIPYGLNSILSASDFPECPYDADWNWTTVQLFDETVNITTTQGSCI